MDKKHTWKFEETSKLGEFQIDKLGMEKETFQIYEEEGGRYSLWKIQGISGPRLAIYLKDIESLAKILVENKWLNENSSRYIGTIKIAKDLKEYWVLKEKSYFTSKDELRRNRNGKIIGDKFEKRLQRTQMYDRLFHDADTPRRMI